MGGAEDFGSRAIAEDRRREEIKKSNYTVMTSAKPTKSSKAQPEGGMESVGMFEVEDVESSEGDMNMSDAKSEEAADKDEMDETIVSKKSTKTVKSSSKKATPASSKASKSSKPTRDVPISL